MSNRKEVPPISQMDYRRIFSVLQAVLTPDVRALHHACGEMTMIAAELLRVHHRVDARPLSGAAFFYLGGDTVLTFAERHGDQLSAGDNGFHSWIECEGYVIDLLAPLFPENIAEINPAISIPRRSFVRAKSSMSSTIPSLGDLPGTFFLVEDAECQHRMISRFQGSVLARDLMTLCSTWYTKYPAKIAPGIVIADKLGKRSQLMLKNSQIEGSW